MSATHLTLTADLKQQVLELQEALDMATGPHCSSCANPIDPDTCWCGASDCSPYDGHSFCPMGCTCGFGTENRDWKEYAGKLRELLWQEQRKVAELTAKLAKAVST